MAKIEKAKKETVEARAIARYVRVTPRKARLVIDLIRGRKVGEALNILAFTPRHACRIIEKVLRSAVANAEQKKVEDVDKLRITKAYVDPGPMWKRVMPRAMGRANLIRKRTSHITVVVSEEIKG